MGEIVKLLVGGVNYAPYVDINEAPEAVDNTEKNQNGMRFRVYLDGEVVMPRAGAEVVWARYDDVSGDELAREFAGVVSSVEEDVEGGTLVYDVDCRSYERWFDRRLVTGFFQQQAAATTITQIVTSYCPGFTANNVYAPLTVVPQYFQYQRPSQAVRNICDQIGFGWYIDYYKDVHVYNVENFVSPLPSNILAVDTDVVNYGNLRLRETTDDVYNRFIVRGYKQRSSAPYTLKFRGDGYSKQWNLGYRFSSAKGDMVVTVGGTPYTVKRDILDGLPGQAADAGVAYVHLTQHTLRLASAPADGVIIEFTGYPLIDKTRIDQDDASVKYMKALEGGDGIREYAEVDKSLGESTSDAVTAKLQLLALKYGFPRVTGSFTSYLSGWRAGQFFRMTSARRFGGLSADQRYWITKVTKRWIQAYHGGETKIEYQIEFQDRPYLIS